MMLVIPATFYVAIAVLGVSLQQARDDGWVQPLTQEVSVFYRIWELFDFSKVVWWTMREQILTWVGMFFVVAFSSCLDVAAIEMDMVRGS